MINKINSINENSFRTKYSQKIKSVHGSSPFKGIVLNFRTPLRQDVVTFGAIPTSLEKPKIEKSIATALRRTLFNFSTEIVKKIRPYQPVVKNSGLKKISQAFKDALNPKSDIFKESVEDLKFILEKDPALKEKDEKEAVIYKSLVITFAHRVAHDFYKKGETTLARVISESAKEVTGAEIHPGATIGSQIFIDHPTGLVVGECTKIGNRFHGHGNVLLGSDGVDTSKNRHPIIGNDVTIWPKANIHGGKTIGDGSVIGCNAVVTENVPANSVVVGTNLLVKLDGKSIKTHLKDYWENLSGNIIEIVSLAHR